MRFTPAPKSVPSFLNFMSSKSKVKGTVFEREIVNYLKARDVDAKRAYASNGESLPGCTAEVDVLADNKWKIQAKRRKRVADFMQPPEGTNVAMIRQDRGKTLVVMFLDEWTKLIKGEE